MTIFAPATAAGRAAIAVIRVSGPEAGAALAALAGPLPPPRRASRRVLRAAGGEALDDGLVLWMPGPASYTGEDMAEFHVHGGRAVVEAVLAALGALPGLRPAEPGEFTRRAFDNGRLDLTAVEGLADLVAAETQAQRRQALRQAGGALAALYERWRAGLVEALARAEAAIDFDDEDLPETLDAAVRSGISGLLGEITQHLDDEGRGERLRDGALVVILGAPNVGKSSLLNRLARREAAIVSTRAGTTRDVIEVRMEIDGFPATLADTAGLRATADAVEVEGVRRARAHARVADLRIALFDATRWPETDAETRALVDAETLVAVNKTDLAPLPPGASLAGRPVIGISCRSGAGMGALLSALGRALAERLDTAAAPALTRERHRRALADCRDALARALDQSARGGAAAELAAEDLRLAVRALGRLTGRVDVEDLLDAIFAEFCIGK